MNEATCTTTDTWAEPSLWALFVALAVIVCVPMLRLLVVKLVPVPIWPSRSEVQTRLAATSPSTRSVAVAKKVAMLPARKPSLCCGSRITTAGMRMTVSVMVADPTRPPVSVTVAVMRCVPSLSMLVAKVAPLARTPSRSDVHWTVEERSPSVASSAVTLKDVLASCVTVLPAAGDVMVSAGGVGVMMTVICAVEVAPSESVTDAVIVCWPSRSRTAFEAPTKSAPWRLDVHCTWLEMLPSKSSLATAVSVTSVSAGAEELSCGAVTVSAGATFGPRTRTMTWA